MRFPYLFYFLYFLGFGLAVQPNNILQAQTLTLDPSYTPKFQEPLPKPTVVNATNGGSYTINMRETSQWLGIYLAGGQKPQTKVWGYGEGRSASTYPGPTILARANVDVYVKWENLLPTQHLLPVDQSLHWAHAPGYPRNGIPVVTHLHGGHTESASDGLPEAWYTQRFKNLGPDFVKKTYHYHNNQEAATLWYHDHALGITRLNVYAGLAGFYLLRDQNEINLINSGVLPSGEYEREIVVQDRNFDTNGQLFLPSTNPDVVVPGDPDLPPWYTPLPLPAGPSVIAEFFGDHILVNGMAWPKMEVEPRKYRLRMLNGSDSRFYVFEFRTNELGDGSPHPFYQIGTDNGLLVTPVPMTQLLLAPGERADLIVDFTGQNQLWLRNFGPDAPFKGFNADGTISDGQGGSLPPADPGSTGQIMKFVVNKPLSGIPQATVTPPLRGAIQPLQPNSVKTRQLVLFEGRDEYGRLQPLLGTMDQGSLTWSAPITENPMLNDTETWEVYNATEDAHPIHLHLVKFQIVGRASFEGDVTPLPVTQHSGATGLGGMLTVNSTGTQRDPEDNEKGWKDTAVMLPGEVTTVVATFDRPGRFVWHCHILSHEDHEMMRPYEISSGGPGFALVANTPEADYPRLMQNYPNPFSASTQIQFYLPKEAKVDLRIFNLNGQFIKELASGQYPSGEHSLDWNSRDAVGRIVPDGIYIYQLKVDGTVLTKRLSLIR